MCTRAGAHLQFIRCAPTLRVVSLGNAPDKSRPRPCGRRLDRDARQAAARGCRVVRGTGPSLVSTSMPSVRAWAERAGADSGRPAWTPLLCSHQTMSSTLLNSIISCVSSKRAPGTSMLGALACGDTAHSCADMSRSTAAHVNILRARRNAT